MAKDSPNFDRYINKINTYGAAHKARQTAGPRQYGGAIERENAASAGVDAAREDIRETPPKKLRPLKAKKYAERQPMEKLPARKFSGRGGGR